MIEEELIKKCITGDRLAQEKLYNTYASRMKGICVRYARSAFEAEDIFQDGFLAVFTNLGKYKGTGSFDGWIRRIMIYTAIDTYKKDLPLKQQVTYDSAPEVEALEISGLDLLNEQELIQMIQQLPEGYRIVFNLYVVEGFSHKEIAELLNISASTSKTQLFKAKKTLQALVEHKS